MIRRPAVAIGAVLAAAGAMAVRADAPRGRIVTVEHTPLTDAPTRGPRDAPVTVEVYFATGSELGNQAYKRAMALWRKHPARVRLVFRPMSKSDNSEVVAPIAMAAHARGRFFELMDELVSQPGPQPTIERVLDAAVRAGLDRQAAEAALPPEALGRPRAKRRSLTVEAIERALDANEWMAERARTGIRADLVVNGRPIGPTPDETTLEAAYRQALEIARIELAAGAPAAALPSLAVRRARCLEARERPRAFRADGRDDDGDDEDELAPVAGWHLGALLRDGTGCPPEPTPTGRPDQAFDVPPELPRGALLSAPLATDGLPSCGPADAPVVVHVVCSLRNPTCGEQLSRARRVAEYYGPAVRVVYRPWVDLDGEASALELPLAQAALCSQQLGDGWKFVMALRGLDRETLALDGPVERAAISKQLFDACVDGSRDGARRVVAEARAAGVAWSPTVVVGQRAYVGGITDDRPLEDLIDAELAPGLLGATADAALPRPAATAAADTCNKYDD